MRYTATTLANVLFLIWPAWTTAAPLDEFMTALPGHAPWHGEVEVGLDIMNGTVDLLNVRQGHLDARGDTIGDYSGGHLRGRLALTKRLGVEAAVWKRAMKTPFDEGESLSWQGAMQYQATINIRGLPAVALRVSGWGDSTDEVLKGSATNLFNLNNSDANTRKMRVEDPQDTQFQGDIIGSWTLSSHSLFSTFVSMGVSSVDFGHAYAELQRYPEGCEYQLSAAASKLHLRLVNSDTHRCVIKSMTPNLNFPMPDGMYIRYDATYFQTGGNLQWFNETWRTRIGYRFQKWNRGELDEAVERYQHTPDKTVYDVNHHLTAEVAYRVRDKTGLFIRGQLMQHQFVGDVPFSYNLFSSHKFQGRYGFLTFGIVQVF